LAGLLRLPHVVVQQTFKPGKEPKKPEITAPPFEKKGSEHSDKTEGEEEEAVVRRTTIYKFDRDTKSRPEARSQ
jgi:hypothetical protein